MTWVTESYSPLQTQLAARAPADLLGVAPGYWSDAEVTADVIQYLNDEYGITDIEIASTLPAQSKVENRPTVLESNLKSGSKEVKHA